MESRKKLYTPNTPEAAAELKRKLSSKIRKRLQFLKSVPQRESKPD
jgi:hypothetical protein